MPREITETRIDKTVEDITPIDANTLMEKRLELRTLKATRNARDKELGVQREAEMVAFQSQINELETQIETLETKQGEV